MRTVLFALLFLLAVAVAVAVAASKTRVTGVLVIALALAFRSVMAALAVPAALARTGWGRN